MKFDENSATRERLALLAWMSELSYDAKSDTWIHPSGVAIEVRGEGTASLGRLEAQGISRAEAMAEIGYPEIAPHSVKVARISRDHFQTVFSVGVQGFVLANTEDSEEGKEHCEFIQKMFRTALAHVSWEKVRKETGQRWAVVRAPTGNPVAAFYDEGAAQSWINSSYKPGKMKVELVFVEPPVS